MNIESVEDIDLGRIVAELPTSTRQIRAMMMNGTKKLNESHSAAASVRITEDGPRFEFSRPLINEMADDHKDLAFLVFHEMLHILEGHQNLEHIRSQFRDDSLMGDYESMIEARQDEVQALSEEEREEWKLLQYAQELEIKHMEHLLFEDDRWHRMNKKSYGGVDQESYRIFYRHAEGIEDPLYRGLHKSVFSDGRFSPVEARLLLQSRSEDRNPLDPPSGPGESDEDGESTSGENGSEKEDSGEGETEESESEEGESGEGESGEDEPEEGGPDGENEDGSGEDAGESGEGDNSSGDGIEDGESESGSGESGDGESEEGSGEGSGEGSEEESGEGSGDSSPTQSDIQTAMIHSESGVEEGAEEEAQEMIEAIKEAVESESSSGMDGQSVGEWAETPEVSQERNPEVGQKMQDAGSHTSFHSKVAEKIDDEVGRAIRRSPVPNFRDDHDARIQRKLGGFVASYKHRNAADSKRVAFYYDVSGSQTQYIPACNQIVLENKRHIADREVNLFTTKVQPVPVARFHKLVNNGEVQSSVTGRGTNFDAVIRDARDNGHSRICVLTDDMDEIDPDLIGPLARRGSLEWILVIMTEEKSDHRRDVYPGFIDGGYADEVVHVEPAVPS